MNTAEIDKKQINEIKNEFLRLSQLRFSRMEASLSPTLADKLKLLPLLFHVNHPMLPGYVDKFTPCGIPNYSPSQLEKKIAKTVSQSFEYKPRAHLKYQISSLFLMGSMGTLGQSNQSDIDLWICLDEYLDPKLKHKLSEKTKGIKEWFAGLGIELNSYIVSSDEFSAQNSRVLESDNCGNAQNFLLLDEFYRTAVWIAGRWPLWWVIPQLENHNLYGKRLLNQKHLDSADWIDFGEVKSIPASEYFSAALWQLYKALESPYKSAVKLLVLEVYAKQFPCAGILSDEFKEWVYSGKSKERNLDPYLLTLKFAEKALADNPQRLEFLRRAFYLKTNIKINLSKNKPSNWRYQTVKKLVKSWQWNQMRLDYLNSRQKWDIRVVKDERISLVRELTSSYHFLSNFSRVHGVINRVAKNELLSLGRKLYAAFERRSGKIEIVNCGIAKDIFEPSITINQKNEDKWEIYVGHIEQKKLTINSCIFSSQSLFECLFWGQVNGVISNKSRLHIYPLSQYHDLKMASDLSRDISNLLVSFKDDGSANQYNQEVKTIHFGIFMNSRTDPLAEEKSRDLYQIASGADCFSWAENKTNLASHFDVVLFNSWGEITTKHFSGPFAWMEFFKKNVQIINGGISETPIYCRGLVQKDLITARIRKLFDKWNNLRLSSFRTHHAHRYVLTVSGKWMVINIFQDDITYQEYSSLAKLYSSLSDNLYINQPEIKTKYNFDDHTVINVFIQAVLKRRFSDSLDFYVNQKNKQLIEVIIRSSNGSIHYQAHKNTNIRQVINHYQQFFEKIQNRNLLNNGLLEKVHFFQFIRGNTINKPRIKSIKVNSTDNYDGFRLVQAIATQKHVLSAGFDLYTSESCFLYVDHGEGVYAKLRDEILSFRENNEHYPIFLTDIDLSAINEKVSIVEALVYKKSIERKLNRLR